MSSGGQFAGGVVGAVAGFFLAGPGGALKGALLGAQLGMTVGGLLDPPKGPNMQGPRLADLSVQTSTYGADLPRVYGTVALVGNVFWLENNALTETAHTSSNSGGHKGGGGGSSGSTTTYTYSGTFAVGFAKCKSAAMIGVRRIWISSKLIYDAGSADPDAITASNEAATGFAIYLGSDTQVADTRMEATLGAGNVPGFRGLAYIVFYDLAMADFNNSLMGAQIKVEWAASDASNISTSLSFTPPAEADVDAYSSYNVLRLNFNGSNGSTTFTDETGKTVSVVGNTQISTAQSEYGGASGLFDGSGDYLTVPFDSGFRLGTDFTVETYVRFTGYPVNYGGSFQQNILSTYGAPSNFTGWQLRVEGTVSSIDYLSFFTGTTLLRTAHSFALNTWYHIAVSRSSSTAKLFVDGVCISTFTNSDTIFSTGTSNLHIGRLNVSEPVFFQYLRGYLDFLRITNGLDRYTGTDIITTGADTLANIVSAEVLQSNLLDASDIDVTDLTDSVRGYRIGGVSSIRAALEPLQAAFPFDVVQSGYTLSFIRRGNASVATITDDELDARSAGNAPGVQFTMSREMDSVLPRRVTIKYIDGTREYDAGEQLWERTNTDAINTLSMELPIVMTASEAVQKAEILLYMYWLERYDVGPLNLPPTHLNKEPADVVTVTTDNGSFELRLTQINYAPDGRLQVNAKLNNAAVYTSVAVGAEGASTGTVITWAGLTVYELLDIPLLLDDQDTAGYAVVMGGTGTSWPGGLLYRSTDSGSSWGSQTIITTSGAVGTVSDSLAVHDGRLIDKKGVLTATMQSGADLESVTELQMLNGSNLFAYGVDGRWEIIAAKNCVENIDGTWTLTDFLRGRHGTEWATGLHSPSDHLIKLDQVGAAFVSINAGTIGNSYLFRGITSGKDITTDTNRSFAYQGVNLECLSPVYLNGNINPGTSDWALDWIRRTRIGGEWRDYVDATLGETSERYEMDIYADGTYVTVKRTISATTAACAYTSAQQVTDFGGNQTTLYVKLYQLSETVGRGYPLTTSITR